MASVSTTLARKPTAVGGRQRAFLQRVRVRQPERLVRHRSRPPRSQRRRRRRRRDAGDPGLAVGGHARGGQTRSEEAPERTCQLPGSVE